MKKNAIVVLGIALSTSWAQSPLARPTEAPADRSVIRPVTEAEKDRIELDRAVAARAASTGLDQTGWLGITVELQNISGRTITAHGGSLTARYPDGHEVTQEWSSDVLGNTIMSQIPGITMKYARTFRNGETWSHKLFLRPVADGVAPVSLTARATMVVFDDRTTLGATRLLNIVAEGRKRGADDLLDINQRLDAALSNPAAAEAIRTGGNPMPAIRAALSEQIAKVGNLPAEQRRSRDVMLQQYLALTQYGLSPDILKTFLAANQVVQRSMVEHSRLVESK